MRFSWTNNREEDDRAMARLDILYLFKNIANALEPKLTLYTIKGDLTRLDHHLVFASVQLEDKPAKITHWKMNSKWLEEAAPSIRSIWKDVHHILTFFAKLRKVIRFYQGMYRTKAASFRADEEAISKDLEEATW